jgi:hypothetical protein
MSIESSKKTTPLETVASKEDKVIKTLKKKRVAIVDTREALEYQARDIAEERPILS